MPDNYPTHIDFAAILASSVHDMKNSLTVIRSRINDLPPPLQSSEKNTLLQLQYEANRMNNSLMQLLQLYKIDLAHFQLEIDEYPVSDIIQEILAQQANLLSFNGIEITSQCNEELYCFCDFNLVCNALGSILNNAQRYAKGKIQLHAEEQQGFIRINIKDDGAGYPVHLLHSNWRKNNHIDFQSGSTGLGIYFAATIAEMHQSENLTGFVEIANSSDLAEGGACFSLFLP